MFNEYTDNSCKYGTVGLHGNLNSKCMRNKTCFCLNILECILFDREASWNILSVIFRRVSSVYYNGTLENIELVFTIQVLRLGVFFILSFILNI